MRPGFLLLCWLLAALPLDRCASAVRGEESKSPAKFVIYAPENEAELRSSLYPVLVKGKDRAVRIEKASELESAVASQAEVIILLLPARNKMVLNTETVEALKHRKIIGIGYGAAQLFNELGLLINWGKCVHGGVTQLDVQRSGLLGEPKTDKPIDVFNHLEFGGKADIFRLFLPESVKTSSSIDVIARSDDKHALVVRQGKCVLIGFPVPAKYWSASYTELIADVCQKLHDTDPPGHCDDWLYSKHGPVARGAYHGSAELGDDFAIYLASRDAPGGVTQIDRTGKRLGTIELPGSCYELTAQTDGLVAMSYRSGNPVSSVIRSDRTVIRIDRDGTITELYPYGAIRAMVSTMAINPESNDVVLGSLYTNELSLLPEGKLDRMRPLVQLRQGRDNGSRNMSVKYANDGYVLFSSSDPRGVYRFPATGNSKLGPAILPEYGIIAVDPSSNRWAVALSHELKLFEATQELDSVPYPDDCRGLGALAFGPSGALVAGLRRREEFINEVVLVDFKAKSFHKLFAWYHPRINSLAVARKANWDVRREPD